MGVEANTINNIKGVNKETLVSLLHGFDRTKINSLFIWTMAEYQQTVSLYRIQKDSCKDEIDAFVSLWLASKIDYEDWWTLNKSMDESEAEALYEYNLKQYIDDIDLVVMEPGFLSTYPKGKIDEKVMLVKKFRARYPKNNDDLNVASTVSNGIYLDYKFTDEDMFDFKEVKAVSGYQMCYDNSYAGYRDLFFESEEEYFYFTE